MPACSVGVWGDLENEIFFNAMIKWKSTVLKLDFGDSYSLCIVSIYRPVFVAQLLLTVFVILLTAVMLKGEWFNFNTIG